MIVGVKDLIRLSGLAAVCFCAVFVSTFFLNYYLDLSAVEVDAGLQSSYDAQISMAQFTSGITAGFLGVIAIIMLIFYVRLYVNSHAVQLGILKAMGYTDFEISIRFCVFALPVLIGAGVGYGAGHAIMPFIYDALAVDGLPEVEISYHVSLLFAFVVAPAALYCLLSCLFAYISLKRPVGELLRGRAEKVRPRKKEEQRVWPFKRDMLIKSVTSKKLVAFFVFFGAFCFSAMIQVGCSMWDLSSSKELALIVLLIGVVLAVVPLFMAVTTLVGANAANVCIMKAYGYTLGECALSVLGGYVPLAFFGFAVGTGYQYGLMVIMIDIFFKDVQSVEGYSFDVAVTFITLAAFIVFFAATVTGYLLKMRGMTLKRSAEE